MTGRTGGPPGLPPSAARGRATGRRMVVVEQERSAALLVRVWTEGPEGGFRARVTAVDTSGSDSTGEELTVAVAASSSDLLDALREWLEEFVHRSA